MIRPSVNQLSGGERRRIDLRKKWDSVIFYFTLSIMYNIDETMIQGKGDDKQRASEELSANAPSVSV